MERVYIVGLGPGHEDYLLPVAKLAIESADTLIGSRRQLAPFRDLNKKEIVLAAKPDRTLAYIRKNRAFERMVVLVSGDPGLFSMSVHLTKSLAPEDYVVIPGLSPFQVVCARLGKPWQDAVFVSAHGRPLENLLEPVKAGKMAIVYTDKSNTPDRIAAYLVKCGLRDRNVCVAENVSYADERILETTLFQLAAESHGWGLCLMVIETFGDQQVRNVQRRSTRGRRPRSGRQQGEKHGLETG